MVDILTCQGKKCIGVTNNITGGSPTVCHASEPACSVTGLTKWNRAIFYVISYISVFRVVRSQRACHESNLLLALHKPALNEYNHIMKQISDPRSSHKVAGTPKAAALEAVFNVTATEALQPQVNVLKYSLLVAVCVWTCDFCWF